MELDILKANNEKIVTLTGVKPSATVNDIKTLIYKQKSRLYPERQSLRLEARGKSLRDEQVLRELELKNGRALYLRDLGPQVQWKTVFLWEYFGPLWVYFVFYFRPNIIYGHQYSNYPMPLNVKLAMICWTFHYSKRLLETLFVHRFSHATMPVMNLFKNCSYYWGFAAFISYYVNHPLNTQPFFGSAQIFVSFVLFWLFEFGNLSIHLLLRDLRPPGTKERKIPRPNSNPFTLLFNYVSCPNYAYEWYSWAAFSALTQSLPAFLFTLVGLGQMSIWALNKHRQYIKEFKDYPRRRKAIIPFIL